MDTNTNTTQEAEVASHWIPTYGAVTAEKILERYDIRLTQEELFHALSNQNCVFLRLIQVPLKHVFNGLILQQAKDYQTYAQKQYIDYLISGDVDQEESQSGGELEATRKELVTIGEAFQEEELINEKLIAQSQLFLIKTTQKLNQKIGASAKKIKQAFIHSGFMAPDDQVFVKILHTLLCNYDENNGLPDEEQAWMRVEKLVGRSFELSLRDVLRAEVAMLSKMSSETQADIAKLTEEVLLISQSLKRFRADFASIIVRTNELLTMVSGYRIDEHQLKINQQDLYFDAKIGEKA